MVINGNIQDIFDAFSKVSNITLPPFKQIPIKIEYGSGTGNDSGIVNKSQKPPLPFAQSDVFPAKIIQSKRLTAVSDDCKSVYEVTFDVTGSNFKHKPGDTIGIIPTNKTSDVDSVIQHLDLITKIDLSYNLIVDKTQKGYKLPAYIPIQSTLRYVLTHCFDLRGTLKKLFILALSRYTKDENDRKILEFLCSKEGSASYNTHILNKNMCILDIFTIFKTCQPPIEVLLMHLPRLLPRPYSIANSYTKNINIIKICFSVIDIYNRKGLVTGWLEDLISNNLRLEKQFESLNICNKESAIEIPIYLRSNITSFCLPENDETSMILIGPGAGVAPFMGFLEDREIKRKENKEIDFGKIWLFYGCRNPNLDFLYEKELREYVNDGVLDELVTAFSRVDNNGAKYVQDAILKNGEEITQLLKNGAAVFVCGDHKTMEIQVKETLIKCLVDHENMSIEESQQFITDLQKNKKYLTDVWS